MKKGFLVSVCAAVMLSVSACSGKTAAPAETTTTAESVAETSVEESTPAESAETEAESEEVKADDDFTALFDKIKDGMSYDEVVAIMGSEGQEIATGEGAGTTFATYEWTSPDGVSTIQVATTAGAVSAKSQVNKDDIENEMSDNNTNVSEIVEETDMGLKQLEELTGEELIFKRQ